MARISGYGWFGHIVYTQWILSSLLMKWQIASFIFPLRATSRFDSLLTFFWVHERL
jgi:hypothetical protein